jgi:hypothetical protein
MTMKKSGFRPFGRQNTGNLHQPDEERPEKNPTPDWQ